MLKRLRYWILTVVVVGLKIGAHCGLCGKWMENELTYRDWPISVCYECAHTDILEGKDA
jgi:hypothetical protein